MGSHFLCRTSLQWFDNGEAWGNECRQDYDTHLKESKPPNE